LATTPISETGDVVAVVAGHQLAVGGRALRRGGDQRRALAQVAGALGRGDDQRDAAVALLATVEEPQHRLDDPARRLVILERDRPLVEPGVGIGRGVLAVDHRDTAEVGVGDAVLMHVAPGMNRDPRRGRQQPERSIPIEPRRQHRRARHPRTAEAHAGALVERAIAHDDVGNAGRDGHCRLQHDAACRAAAVGNAAEHG
jgi:hypothetical protein